MRRSDDSAPNSLPDGFAAFAVSCERLNAARQRKSETLRTALLTLALPLLMWSPGALSADASANSGSTPVPAMTVPLSGYLTPRAKEVIITQDAWGLNGFTAPSGDPNAPLGVLLSWDVPTSGRANALVALCTFISSTLA